MADYKSVAKVTKISAMSRISIKIKDNFYTVEYSEERELPEDSDFCLETEQDLLFDSVNSVVDAQAEDILKTFRK